MNVLVLAVGSPLGQSITKALVRSELPLRIHVADIHEHAPGLHFEGVTPVVLPPVRSERYLPSLAEYLERWSISVVFPVIEAEHEALYRNSEMLSQLDVKVASVAPSVYGLCRDKLQSMRHLRDAGIAAPETVAGVEDPALSDFLERHGFPVFMKPRFGASSSEVFIARGRSALQGLMGAFSPGHFVIQQFLDDSRDYTAGVFVTRDRSIRQALVIERELRFGLSYSGVVILDSGFEDYCIAVADAVEATHSVNVQFKLHQGQAFAYEINPRLSSTAAIRARFGFNEPEMIVRDMMGLEQPALRLTSGKFARHWEETYLEVV